jgi:hypothetical protein
MVGAKMKWLTQASKWVDLFALEQRSGDRMKKICGNERKGARKSAVDTGKLLALYTDQRP